MILPQSALVATKGVDPIAQALTQATEPFTWAHGGLKMTPEQAAMMRQQGMARSQGDYSPVQHWTQGLARVADNVLGALDVRNAEKAQAAGREADIALAEALPNADDATIARALIDPNVGPGARELASMEYARRQPKSVEPVIQRANNGDIIGLDPMTGREVFRNVDPNPKPVFDWMTVDNPDGTKQIIPVGPNGPIMGGGGQASGAQPGGEPPAVLPSDFFDGEGGGGAAPDPFRGGL